MTLVQTATLRLDLRTAHLQTSSCYQPSTINYQLSPRSAFTLIELMISIALVLLLILGVNQIFSYTTQAVGAGQALSAAVRDSRAAQSQFDSDMTNLVPPGPYLQNSACMVLSSSSVFGFRDKNDQASDRDGNPWTRDLRGTGIDGDPNVPGDSIPAYTYNYRNHRLDTFSFFARNLFNRQTGNADTFVDNLATQEAWIWYGHLWLPDNTGTYNANTKPGVGPSASNPNNYYATQLVLGRVAILLKEKSSDDNSGLVYDNYGAPQTFFNRTKPYPSASGFASDLEPLQGATMSSDNNYAMLDPKGFRYDLAATTISGFKTKLLSLLNLSNTGFGPSYQWWASLVAGNLGGTNNRFQCNPFISKPMDAKAMAQASPYFLGGCSQFIVEYAGDYMKQDNNPADSGYSLISGAGSDGQIDYVLVGPVGQQRKQIIWYGLPRNTSGGSGINGSNGDVIPLASWLGIQQSFEKSLPYAVGGNPNTTTPGTPYLPYVCAWGPNDTPPSLIRITITLDDPTGRLPEGQTYQYIYNVPPQQ